MRRLTISLLTLLLACGGSPTGTVDGGPTVARSVTVEKGRAQRGPPEEHYPDSIVARATDNAGNPISGQIVNFQPVTEGSGTFEARTLQTRSDGRVFNRWRAGEKAWTMLWITTGDTMHVAELIASRDGRPDLVETVRAVTEPGPVETVLARGTGGDTRGPSPHTLPLWFAGDSCEDGACGWIQDAHGNPHPFDVEIPGAFGHTEASQPMGFRRTLVMDAEGCGRFDLVAGDSVVASGAVRMADNLPTVAGEGGGEIEMRWPDDIQAQLADWGC